jgi:hypothetical protein
MEPHLPIGDYVFRFKALTSINFPSFIECIWHSRFGSALRKLTCLAPSSSCHICLLKAQCHYAFLFKGVRPQGAAVMTRYKDIPVPHIFRTKPEDKRHIRAGESFSVGMVLVGCANDRLPVVIKTMSATGKSGFDDRGGRCVLQEVVRKYPEDPPCIITGQEKYSYGSNIESPRISAMPTTVQVRFYTPYLYPGRPAKKDHFDLPRFLMAVIRRVSMLQYFYTAKLLDADFKMFKVLASNVQWFDDGLVPYKGYRYHGRQKGRIPLYGMEGHFDLLMTGSEALWPYLYMGQWLQIGKKASMGFGRYQLFNCMACQREVKPGLVAA